MADPQRTHKASPKRRQEYRKRGDIPLSRDVVSTAALLGGAIGLATCGATTFRTLAQLCRNAVTAMDGTSTYDLPQAARAAFVSAVLPVVVGAAVAALIAIFGQLGWPPAWKGIGFDLGKLSPAKNLPQTFGFAAIARRTGTGLAKLVVVGAIVAGTLGGDALVRHSLPPQALAALAGTIISRVLWSVTATLAGLAAIDYLLARRRMTTQMKMTSEEMKREHRESDGDPQVKGKRRQKMKELAKRRMAAAVASADVVIVNPTHYSVALRYTEGKDHAPVVVAKGVDESAAKIREIARYHGIPVLERPPLARALWKHVKEGRTVPANLYKAVAEVLAYVYRLRHR